MVFTIIKIIFYSLNTDLLPLESSSLLGLILFKALRFDLVAIIYVNSLFILLSLLPFAFRQDLFYKKIQQFIFLITNGIAVLFETIDIGFFPFAFRRTIGSDLNLFQNTAEMAPGFIKEYWFLVLIFFILNFIIFILYKKTDFTIDVFPLSKRIQSGFFILGIVLFGIGARGGLQLRPVMPITAIQYVDNPNLAPLVNNTSLSLIFSSQQHFLKEKTYFQDKEQESIFNSTRQYHYETAMEKKNVFIIVLESFGQEHVSHYNTTPGSTPFLDALIEQSLYMDQSYANGLRSTQGIVAITSSIPAFMQSPLMFSAYQSNRIDGLAKILSDRGYITSFFHGANPGSMEFERFSKLTGFQHYYDRINFNNDTEYDGQWGIWDEPFFQYIANQVDQYDQPFCALSFSLTSHHPYKTPKQFEQKYPDMPPLIRSVRYTDYALQKFFEKAATMDWYSNTIFVITADHIGRSDDKAYQTKVGKYKIPIVIFDPNQSIQGKKPGIFQQIDIMPTILDILKYDEPFSAYGESILDTMRTNYSYNFNSDVYQILDNEYLLLFDEKTTIGLYRYKEDPFLRDNLIKEESIDYMKLENSLKAIIQHHHKEMIKNTLYKK